MDGDGDENGVFLPAASMDATALAHTMNSRFIRSSSPQITGSTGLCLFPLRGEEQRRRSPHPRRPRRPRRRRPGTPAAAPSPPPEPSAIRRRPPPRTTYTYHHTPSSVVELPPACAACSVFACVRIIGTRNSRRRASFNFYDARARAHHMIRCRRVA